MVAELVLICANVGTASLLFVSGAGKLVSPHQLARAIHSVVGRTTAATPAMVRGLAALEIATGTLLFIPVTRQTAAWLAGGLGLLFVSAGVFGLRRRSGTACGCFGGTEGRPLGLWNVAVGALLMAVPAVNATGSPAATEYFLISAPSTTAGMVLLSVWMHRRLVRELTRPLRDVS